MNSAQRRKHRRKWRHKVSYQELNEHSENFRFRDMVDWCNKSYGAENWHLSIQDGYYFLFDRPERLTEFILRWA